MRKQAEEALAYNERRFRSLIENIADGIQLVDMKGEVIYVSPSAARLLGYQQGEMEAPITSLIHPNDLPQVAASISKSMTTQEALMQSYRVKHKDGTWRWFEGSITNRLTDPAIGSIVMTFRDVTERRRSEDALRESEENFHSLFEDSPIAIWLEDFSQLKKYLDRLHEQGVPDIKNYLNEHPAELERLSGMANILEINKTSARILGAQTKAEVLKSLPDYFTKESLKVFADEIAALADGQTQFKSEIPVKDLYGKEVIFDLTLTVQPGSEEDLSRVYPKLDIDLKLRFLDFWRGYFRL